MAFNAAGELVVVEAPGAVPRNFNGSVPTVASTGAAAVDSVGAIDHYAAGLPFTAAGDLCVESAAPATYSQGVGFTAAKRVAIE